MVNAGMRKASGNQVHDHSKAVGGMPRKVITQIQPRLKVMRAYVGCAVFTTPRVQAARSGV